jgi:5-(carboxyamino)imidazole ribonucleotide synthase
MSGPILPGSTIGIFGGGQLGRMTGLAARTLGYDVHVLDPDPHCSARAVASRVITARFDDVEAARDLAAQADVVTLEIEQIGVPALQAAAAHSPGRGPDLHHSGPDSAEGVARLQRISGRSLSRRARRA